MKLQTFFLILILAASCSQATKSKNNHDDYYQNIKQFKKSDLIGVYTCEYKGKRDTIELNENKTYDQKYLSHNDSLVYVNGKSWKLFNEMRKKGNEIFIHLYNHDAFYNLSASSLSTSGIESYSILKVNITDEGEYQLIGDNEIVYEKVQ